MKKRLSTFELAQKLDRSPERIRELAREGRITACRKDPETGHYSFHPTLSRIIRPLGSRGKDDDAPIEHRVKELRYWMNHAKSSRRRRG